jgi:hypothetical protein
VTKADKWTWVLVVILTVTAFGISGTDAANTTFLKSLHFKHTHDHFWNYDFIDRSNARQDTPSSGGVDWNMSLLFRNGAEIDRVQWLLQDLENGGYGFKEHGSPMYARLNDGAGWVTDASDGRKGRFCPAFGETSHYRIYAPHGHDYMAAGRFRPNLGHYVLGTIHKDHNECNPDQDVAWAGLSETAEDEMIRDYRKLYGRRSVSDHRFFWENDQNIDEVSNGPDHLWESDGYAAVFDMPPLVAAP